MKSKNKIFLISTFFAIIYLVIILFLVWLLIKDIKNESDALIVQKNEEFSFKNQISQLEEFKQKKDEYQQSFIKADQMFVDSKNPIILIKFLEDLAKDSNLVLNILLVSISDQKIKTNIQPSISFQINFSGNFSDTLKFLNKLENSPYFLLIQNLKMSKSDEIIKPGKNLPTIIKTSCLIKVFVK